MTDGALPSELASRTMFLVWGPPSHANRTRVLAARLGIEVRHVYSTRRRGALAAPLKYPYQTVATFFHLFRLRPRIVFVQNPPSFAAMVTAVYAALTGAEFIVDAHSDAFDSPYWSRPEWLYRRLARRALTTIVTNEHFADRLRSWGASASVVPDIPTRFDHGPYEVGSEFNVAVVATFAADEPIDEVVEAARSLPDAKFRITGDTGRENASVPSDLPANVELTGFLPIEEYYGLLHSSDAVMALTTRNHTMQRGACEALSLGTPIITSDWPVLVEYFRRGTVHVDNSAGGIQRGVETMRADTERHREEIVDLRREVEAEWEAARDGLIELVAATAADNVRRPRLSGS